MKGYVEMRKTLGALAKQFLAVGYFRDDVGNHCLRSMLPEKDDYCEGRESIRIVAINGGASFQATMRLKRDPVGTLATITEPGSPEDGPSEY